MDGVDESDEVHGGVRLGDYERYVTKMLALGLSPCLETVDEEGYIVAEDGRRYSREELRRLLAEDEVEGAVTPGDSEGTEEPRPDEWLEWVERELAAGRWPCIIEVDDKAVFGWWAAFVLFGRPAARDHHPRRQEPAEELR